MNKNRKKIINSTSVTIVAVAASYYIMIKQGQITVMRDNAYEKNLRTKELPQMPLSNITNMTKKCKLHRRDFVGFS